MLDSVPKVKPTILCVDDTPANLMLLNKLLAEHYQVRLVNSGQKALDFFYPTTSRLSAVGCDDARNGRL